MPIIVWISNVLFSLEQDGESNNGVASVKSLAIDSELLCVHIVNIVQCASVH